jgi:hypothetical protein
MSEGTSVDKVWDHGKQTWRTENLSLAASQSHSPILRRLSSPYFAMDVPYRTLFLYYCRAKTHV